MGVSLKPERLKRYKDIAMLLIKYGRSDLISEAGLEGLDLEDTDRATVANAEELAQDLEKLGPTFIKLGQLLSTRADLLPQPYLDALSRLQDQIDPFPYEEAETIVSGELGIRISQAFADFDPVPIAAASLAQVSRCCFRARPDRSGFVGPGSPGLDARWPSGSRQGSATKHPRADCRRPGSTH